MQSQFSYSSCFYFLTAPTHRFSLLVCWKQSNLSKWGFETDFGSCKDGYKLSQDRSQGSFSNPVIKKVFLGRMFGIVSKTPSRMPTAFSVLHLWYHFPADAPFGSQQMMVHMVGPCHLDWIPRVCLWLAQLWLLKVFEEWISEWKTCLFLPVCVYFVFKPFFFQK